MTLFRKGEQLRDDLLFLAFFANISVFSTSEGLVLVDAGGLSSNIIIPQIKEWRPDVPIHSAIFTHGHVDHVIGIRAFEKEYGKISVIAHKNISNRFNRYKKFQSYNKVINGRQFGTADPKWPSNWREPDVVYDNQLHLTIGNHEFVLYHDKGETDDATWVWLPKQKIICTGDLFIWTFPNCGNPQKVQRYPIEWVEALKKMRNLNAELLLPGHGPPILGNKNITLALSETIEALEIVITHAVNGINSGKPLQEIVETLSIPKRLMDRPYLNAVYDEPEFVVRNIWRLYAGWWDGNPTHLKPANHTLLSQEIAHLSGGSKALVDRALVLLNQNQASLASHIIEFALHANPEDAETNAAYAKVFRQMSSEAQSVMARGIYTHFAENPPRSRL